MHKNAISEQDYLQCDLFLREMTLDMRINAFRETEHFKDWVPEEKSHVLCIWLKDDMGGYYSPGKMTIDDSYLIANGGENVLQEFIKSLCREGKKVFEYVYSSNDSEKFGKFLLLLRNTLEIQCYKPSQKTIVSHDVINIIDKRSLN